MVRNGGIISDSNINIAIRNDRYFGSLLNQELPDTTDYSKWECYGIMSNGEPVVAWSYHSFIGCASNMKRHFEAEVSIVSFNKRWATRKRISQILSLFFEKSCYNRLTVLTNSSNRQAVKLTEMAGFTLEGIIRQPADKDQILQFSMLREDWQQGRFYGVC